MYYICKKKEQSLGVLFGIMDTNDGVVEYYSPRDIIDFVKEQGLKIEGVQLNTETGKWNFKVLKPTAFVEAETSSYSEDPKVVKDNTSVSEVSHKELKNAIEVTYPESWGNLDSLSEDKLDEIFKPWKALLDAILYCLGIPQPEFLDFIDGCDCVGYYKLAIPNTPYFMSIFTNPAYASQYTNKDMQDGKVIFKGIGVDIDGLSDKSMDECHFDSQICGSFVAKFKEWLNKLLGNLCLQEVTDFISLCQYAEKLLPKCNSLNYNVRILSNDSQISPYKDKDYSLEDLSKINLTQDILENHYLQSWFGAVSDCSDDYDSGYLYIEYDGKTNMYSLEGVDISDEAIKVLELTGFPKGVLEKICKDNHFIIEGSYKELIDYITSLLSNKDILTQDSDCLKHFIEVAKKVEAKFVDLYRNNNNLGIEISNLLDISIMINGDDCFNLLAEPNFSVSCPNGYSFTKFIASSITHEEGYLMLGFDGNKYSVFVDACEPDRFGFKTMKKDKLLFYGEEKSLISWLSKVVI